MNEDFYKDYFDNLINDEKEYEIKVADEYCFEEDYLWLNVDYRGMVEIPDGLYSFRRANNEDN